MGFLLYCMDNRARTGGIRVASGAARAAGALRAYREPEREKQARAVRNKKRACGQCRRERIVLVRPYQPALPRCGICHLSLDEGWRVS